MVRTLTQPADNTPRLGLLQEVMVWKVIQACMLNGDGSCSITPGMSPPLILTEVSENLNPSDWGIVGAIALCSCIMAHNRDDDHCP